jgi:hypothetical protein
MNVNGSSLRHTIRAWNVYSLSLLFTTLIFCGMYLELSKNFSTSSLDEAKRWFEVSAVICRFVPEGKSRAEKVGLLFMTLEALISTTQDFSNLHATTGSIHTRQQPQVGLIRNVARLWFCCILN